MTVLPESAAMIKIPAMIRIRQKFEAPQVGSIDEVIESEIFKHNKIIKSGMSVAIAVGSRGISNLSKIVGSVAREIKKYGGKPFIVPAMGSHGGATEAGQLEVLDGYGISQRHLGIPVLSSMAVVDLGYASEGVPVFFDRIAYEADLIVPINRIKPHTHFKGPIESGLCKMLAIGLGNHKGCSQLHEEGFFRFNELIPTVAAMILQKTKVGFGIAIVENAYDQTAIIQCVPADRIMQIEPKLLQMAKTLMPRLLMDKIDVLIVEEIGKDISGAGMDPNIIGRLSDGDIGDFQGPSIQRIVILDLTENTHGNATGIGVADFISDDCFAKMNRAHTYANCISSGSPKSGTIPIIMPSEEDAIRAAIATCILEDRSSVRIARIKNTLSLEFVEVSPSLYETIKSNPAITLVSHC